MASTAPQCGESAQAACAAGNHQGLRGGETLPSEPRRRDPLRAEAAFHRLADHTLEDLADAIEVRTGRFPPAAVRDSARDILGV